MIVSFGVSRTAFGDAFRRGRARGHDPEFLRNSILAATSFAGVVARAPQGASQLKRERPAREPSGRPRSGRPQSLVTEWVLPPLFVQVTTPPGTTVTELGPKALSVMLTLAEAAPPAFTTTLAVITLWNLQ